MTVGVISDTHGLLRPEALAALRGVDRILHAGDIGDADVLDRLRQLAPVTVVRGNIDRAPWASALPKTEVVEIEGVFVYMLHDIGCLDLKPEGAGFHVIVCGHTHQPKMEEKNGVLYFNPGSAGPRRFKLPVTVGKLLIESRQIRGELITLKV